MFVGVFIFTLLQLSTNIFHCERSASVEWLQEGNKIDILVCIFLDPFLGLVFLVPNFFVFYSESQQLPIRSKCKLKLL